MVCNYNYDTETENVIEKKYFLNMHLILSALIKS